MRYFATEKYVTGYACKGNQPTEAIADLFQDMVNCAAQSSGATTKSLCSQLLIGTVKRDVSSVETSYEFSGLPLYRSSHTFQSVSLTGLRALDLSKPKSTVTKNTILDKYMNRNEQDKASLYSFICRQGKVPVISSSLTASFPLEEEYCRITLLMHWPNWRKIEDIRTDEVSWTSTMEDFLQSKEYPNFIKAEVERAKQHHTDKNMNDDDDEDNPNDLGEIDEPEGMESVGPNNGDNRNRWVWQILFDKMYRKDCTNRSVQVLCPTGYSANLISGMTIHSFLKIPINARTKEITPPDGASGETLQENLKDLKVLLIDERSLIGATNLGWMECLCRCKMVGSAKFSKSCGGIPVVVFFW